VAALAAALATQGRRTGVAEVQTPGGRLHVAIIEGSSTLTGPAMLVARGQLTLDWWSAY
jgi:diaminopimelate epimerase